MDIAPVRECTHEIDGITESQADLAARFEREAMPYYAVLLRRARRITRCELDAEDLVQDALMNAYTGFHQFRPGTNLRAWLFRIMHNRWVSVHRLKQRRPETYCMAEITDSSLDGGTAQSAGGGRSAEDEALEGLPDRHIRQALQSLPEGFQQVLYYAGVQGHTYAETALLMGIPMGTVMSRMSRGRAQLRIRLADYETLCEREEGSVAPEGSGSTMLWHKGFSSKHGQVAMERSASPEQDRVALADSEVARITRFYKEFSESAGEATTVVTPP